MEKLSEISTVIYKKFYSVNKTLIVLFIGSLIIRLAFWGVLVAYDAAEVDDAYGYFHRALGFENIFISLLQGNRPVDEDLARAYIATWPPLQSFFLSLGLLVFGSNLAVGRLMMVVVSALTTPLVYLVTRRLSSNRAAVAAALIHAIYPSFIHYSVRLFSETTFIFILLLMLYFATMVPAAAALKKASLLAIITGFLLGLAALTRAAVLPGIPVVALWVGWRCPELKKRLLLPALIIITMGITILPWEATLFTVNDRFDLLVTSSDWNLYLGNNPWFPEGYGIGPDRAHLKETCLDYSRRQGISQSAACRALALEEIKADPVEFLRRGYYKVRTMWSMDIQLFRYIFVMAPPPLNNNVVGLLFSGMVISLFLYLALVIWGFFNPTPPLRYRELMGGLILAFTAVSFIVTGLPRYSIPLLAILLPAAGHGAVYLKVLQKREARLRAIGALVSIVVVILVIFPSIPIEYSRINISSHYLELTEQLDRWLGAETVVSDRLLFRTSGDDHPDRITISIVGEDFKFAGSDAQVYIWEPLSDAEILDLVVQSQAAKKAFYLQVKAEPSGQVALLSLKPAWHRWHLSGLPGIDYFWIGTSNYPAANLNPDIPNYE